MEFVKTQRGGLKLCYNGYLYVKNKDLPSGNTFYECERRRRNNCKAKITLRGDQIIRETHEHTHAPDIIRQDLLSLREEMKEQAIFLNFSCLFYELPFLSMTYSFYSVYSIRILQCTFIQYS